MRYVRRCLAVFIGCSLLTAEAADAPGPVAPVPASESIYLESEFLFVESADIQAYLESVMDKLLQGRTEKFTRPRLLIYSKPGFDARSDANENLLISTEALRLLESEDELAALLGHELAHVVSNHPEKKGILQRFPIGVETMAAVAAAGERLSQARKENTAPPTESVKTRKRLEGSQSLSEFWSDLLAPNWNRKQEREADRMGFDMMRAAGYDPSAFATLFSKLHAAQLKRGERMETLRVVMLERAKNAAGRKSAAANEKSAELGLALKGLTDAVSEKAVNALFDTVAKATADYDSPEQRQDLLAKYASEQPSVRRDKTPRSVKFAQVLREGAGGALLRVDADAWRLMTALKAEDETTAREAVAALMPTDAAAGAGKAKKGGGAKETAKAGEGAKTAGGSKGKAGGKAKAGAAQVARVPRPASPHLNLALAQWLEHGDQAAASDERLTEWLEYSRAPSLAYVERAKSQAARAEYDAAIATLKDGVRRVGGPRQFLPTMVAVARDAKNVTAAQDYARQCAVEEQKNKSLAQKVTGLFKADPMPTGLYAECVAQLGAIPPPAGGQGNALTDMPVNAINGLREGVENRK